MSGVRCQVKTSLRYAMLTVLCSSFIVPRSAFPQDPIGPVSRVITNELQAISNQLPAVSVVTPSVVGAQGGGLYYYWVVAKYGRNVVTQDQPAGNAPQSTPALVTTAPTPLTGANYVRVCWNTVPNASGYDVLRTYSDRLPNGAANIGVALNTAGNCVNDQGGALSSYTLNTYNPAKNPASLRWGRMDMPKITAPPQNAPVGQCRMFVNRTTNSFDAVDETGASCFPAGVGTPTRDCTIVAGSNNGPVLANADVAPQSWQCKVPRTATVLEIDIHSDAGTSSVTVDSNYNGVQTSLLSAPITSAANEACANVAGGLGLDGVTTCTATLQNVSIAAGSYFETLSASTAGAHLVSVSVIFTMP